MPNENLPANIGFGTVVGRFGSAPLVAGDADGFPDLSPAAGLTVTFTPSTAAVIDATASPAPVTIEMVPIVCGLDSQGYLVGGDGQRGVKLIATDDVDLNPNAWTYNVTFLRAGQKVAAFRDFSMSLPAGTTKDIALTIPVPSSSGVSLNQAQAAEAAAVAAASQASAAAAAAAASAATFVPATVDTLGQATTVGKALAKATDATAARNAIAFATGVTASTAEIVVAPSGGDDQPAITAAWNLGAATGRRVRLTEGTFQWNGNGSQFTTSTKISGAGRGKTIIQLGSGVNFGFRIRGSKVQVGADNPISNAVRGTRTLATGTDLTASLAAGDAVAIATNAYFGARTYYKQGEWNVVDAITSTTITLKWATRFAYNTSDTIRLSRYTLLAGVDVSDLTFVASTTTQQQTLLTTEYCDAPTISRVEVRGPNADVGIEVKECRDALIDAPLCKDIKGLGNLTPDTWLGYGVHTTGTLGTTVRNPTAYRCRHAFDDSSNDYLPPSLGTKVIGGNAYDCPSSGWSTHGGSDECLFDACAAYNCGGGFVLRGRAGRGRKARVIGGMPSGSNEYTALGGSDQNNRAALLIGELQDASTANPGGTGIDWEFDRVDLTSGQATTNLIYARYADLVDSVFTIGDVTFDVNSTIVYIRSNKVRNVTFRRGTIHNTSTSIAFVASPDTPAVGLSQVDLTFEDIYFDGYSNRLVYIDGSSVVGSPSSGIVVRRLRGRNKNAAYSNASSTIRFNSGFFATTAGSVRVQDNDFIESTTASFFDTTTNGGAGIGTGLTRKGNAWSAGYDTAP